MVVESDSEARLSETQETFPFVPLSSSLPVSFTQVKRSQGGWKPFLHAILIELYLRLIVKCLQIRKPFSGFQDSCFADY